MASRLETCIFSLFHIFFVLAALASTNKTFETAVQLSLINECFPKNLAFSPNTHSLGKSMDVFSLQELT